jgi:acid phosphatase family membrane protein YuiD
MWFNFVLEAAVIANILAQMVKVPVQLVIQRKWNPRMLISTGGMPSSHSAFVAALTTAIGLQEGISSPLFAISFCFAAVVIYDAMGIRRHAGTHAALLNRLLDDLERDGTLAIFQDPKYQQRFKELLGHEPAETFFGTLFGILVAFIYFYLAF